MNKAFEMLAEMDKELNKCIANEEAKIAALNRKIELSQENMVREIQNDLLEYSEYRKKLNVKQNNFVLDVELNPLGFRDPTRKYYIAIVFERDRVILNEISTISTDKHCYNSYGIYSTKKESWGDRSLAGNSLNIIYGNWGKIKREFEDVFTKTYMRQKKEELKRINESFAETVLILNETLTLSENKGE